MEETSPLTKQKIQAAALAEFLDKGFLGASLRQIVKNAGVTTGAFYGYFSSKEALFASIVEPHAAALMGRFMEAQTSFAELPETEQPGHMGQESADYVHWMVDYICQNHEPVKLLLTKAEGTSYEHFVHNMVEVEVEYTLRYMEVLRRLGQNVPELSRSLCHIIASGMFNGMFEIVVHDMPREQAMRDVDQFRAFYTSGWLALMQNGRDGQT
ncbi:MAG TPA: TetR/AcrR family transcriptional regulator [Candidatus Faecalibacterium intestinigallinarum]|uniref:TetR/AcrR family transcriptional regulator n=1 Tax=Candidatus Faecalibacterium intestinigallinarum TaxID=2838581 RepID=A0A9D1TWK7_9FIRM|nr:TetR/AcrR family transcriptional regulator [Candidatus Faecalibacterium intestinigallinarum]